jgi:hypothetical protein
MPLERGSTRGGRLGHGVEIDAGTEERARSLSDTLATRFPGRVSVDATRVLVDPDGPPDRFVVEVLDDVKRWLEEGMREPVRIVIAGRTYTLAPDAPAPAPAS